MKLVERKLKKLFRLRSEMMAVQNDIIAMLELSPEQSAAFNEETWIDYWGNVNAPLSVSDDRIRGIVGQFRA